MDFIKELGITLLVGAFTILGFEAVLHYFFDCGLSGFFEGDQLGLQSNAKAKVNATKENGILRTGGEKEQTITLAVFVACAFAVGIVAEDLSYKFRDSQQIPFKIIPARLLPDFVIQWSGLPSEDDDRVVTMVGSLNQPRPASLTIDLANNDAFRIFNSYSCGDKIKKWILSESPCRPLDAPPGRAWTPAELQCPTAIAPVNDCLKRRQVEASFSDLYFYAKNTVYANQEYQDELKRIQTRLEFTRSLTMISFIYCVFGVVIGIPLYRKNLLRVVQQLWRRKTVCGAPTRRERLRGKIPAVVGTLLLVYFFSLWAFALETEAFNRRAFGYFSTTLISEKRQRALAAPSPSPLPSPSPSP
jgi:hypothetical protein